MSGSLTGSAKITTSTVAFPGVSRLTSGVRTVPPASLTLLSIPGSCTSHFELVCVCVCVCVNLCSGAGESNATKGFCMIDLFCQLHQFYHSLYQQHVQTKNDSYLLVRLRNNNDYCGNMCHKESNTSYLLLRESQRGSVTRL